MYDMIGVEFVQEGKLHSCVYILLKVVDVLTSWRPLGCMCMGLLRSGRASRSVGELVKPVV